MVASVISGLRLEKELALALVAYAETMAEAHKAPMNVAAAARDLIRRGLAATKGQHAPSCDREGYFRGIAEAREKMARALTK